MDFGTIGSRQCFIILFFVVLYPRECDQRIRACASAIFLGRGGRCVEGELVYVILYKSKVSNVFVNS